MKPLIATFHLPAPGWGLKIQSNGQQLIGIDFIPSPGCEIPPADALLCAAVTQLRDYLRDPRCAFELPMLFAGTPFQCRVWDALRRIPAGATQTYGELARQLGSSARAVGGACRANPIAIMVPCHRVVARHSLGGFSGSTAGSELDLKQWLLTHEESIAHHRHRDAAA